MDNLLKPIALVSALKRAKFLVFYLVFSLVSIAGNRFSQSCNFLFCSALFCSTLQLDFRFFLLLDFNPLFSFSFQTLAKRIFLPNTSIFRFSSTGLLERLKVFYQLTHWFSSTISYQGFRSFSPILPLHLSALLHLLICLLEFASQKGSNGNNVIT